MSHLDDKDLWNNRSNSRVILFNNKVVYFGSANCIEQKDQLDHVNLSGFGGKKHALKILEAAFRVPAELKYKLSPAKFHRLASVTNCFIVR